MTATIEWTSEARDRIHNLDLSLPKQQQIYEDIAKEFIMRNEVFYSDKGQPIVVSKIRKGYPDIYGNFTIGIGFNMNRSEARAEWNNVFNGELDFDAVKKGQYSLTEDQIVRLFEHSRQIRLKEIKRIYKEYWAKLKPNERLMIEDAYFNAPKLVRGKSNFAKYMRLYVDSNDAHYLKAAVYEIAYNSHPKDDDGLKERRKVQAEMLSSHKAPLYCKPNELVTPNAPRMKVMIGKTIIPRDPYDEAMKRYLQNGEQPQYQPFQTRNIEGLYIWRSLHDNRVRKSHKDNDGKLFHVDNPPGTGNPGSDYRCRCFADDAIPIWLEIDLRSIYEFGI